MTLTTLASSLDSSHIVAARLRPPKGSRIRLLALVVVANLVACSATATQPVTVGIGPQPVLPAPESKLLPTVAIAPAVGWPEDGVPQAAEDLVVNAFASGLDHPRWLYVLPNGDVLVAESNAPERSGGMQGLKAWFAKRVMKKAGAAVPSANRITLLRDEDGDGVAEFRSAFLSGLNSPFGMTLVGDQFYVANTDALLRFPYQGNETEITAPGVKVADLPGGPINHHWTKNVIASPDGQRLYVTVGSNSNIAENGMENEEQRAAILEIDPKTGATRVFASGLRNPNGLAWQPDSGALWTTVNERDELGDNLVPDYMTSVRDGAFYGWPYSYFGQHVDERVEPQRPDLVAQAVVPDYGLGAHTAALGLAFYTGDSLPAQYRGGAFIGLHGSWNRKPLSGYKVIFVPFEDGQPNGQPIDILDGFVNADGDAQGRPVGVVVDTKGAVLVADDVGNVIWRVTPAQTHDFIPDKTHAVNERYFIGPQPERNDLPSLAAHGITQVINFRTPGEMEELGYDEAQQLADLGISYVHIPVGGDDYPYSPAQLTALGEALGSSRDGDAKVMLHCRSGWRASVYLVAYLVSEQGMEINEAVEHAEGWWPLALEKALGRRYRLVEEIAPQ